MIEGNKKERTTEDKQASEQIPSVEREKALNEEELVEVSGGGLGNMITGIRAAADYGGGIKDILASAKYGLKSDSHTATQNYANARVQQSIRKKTSSTK